MPVRNAMMLAKFLEQDHRQKARSGKAARRDMEWRRRLRDRTSLENKPSSRLNGVKEARRAERASRHDGHLSSAAGFR
jgi:hypothetical protein